MRKIMLLIAFCAAGVLMLASVASAQQEDLDCSDFSSQAEAQATLRQDPSDPYGLDGPKGPVGAGEPGVACEGALPGPVDFTPVANDGVAPGTGVTSVPAEGRDEVGGRITDPVEETPVSVDQYEEDDKISIPEAVPGGETPVEGPPSGGDEVTELPDTGGVSGLMLLGGALLLGGGLMVRRIVR